MHKIPTPQELSALDRRRWEVSGCQSCNRGDHTELGNKQTSRERTQQSEIDSSKLSDAKIATEMKFFTISAPLLLWRACVCVRKIARERAISEKDEEREVKNQGRRTVFFILFFRLFAAPLAYVRTHARTRARACAVTPVGRRRREACGSLCVPDALIATWLGRNPQGNMHAPPA